ncbi:hypothetical protein EXN66_Car017791 [Channa argus]|uniref:Neurofilament medium polypeptide n=1 Tax=Channa argus TaxID=215402 RepID=A0A6G1QIG3_CHAAH|nr:hypothetical protein EXN66_Car017791 [Channa argus]
MKFHVPVFVFIAVASFHTAISASLESAEKEESVVHYDGLSELQKIDQMEFEAAQKAEAAQMNVTEQQNEDIRYLEAGQNESGELHDVAYDDISEGVVASQPTTQEESESSEEANGRQRLDDPEAVTETVSTLDEVKQDSTKEQDVLE